MDKNFAPNKNVTDGTIIYWQVDNLDKIIEKFVYENTILIQEPVEREKWFYYIDFRRSIWKYIGLTHNPYSNEILIKKIRDEVDIFKF